MKVKQWKLDRGWPSREIARAEGYVMVRRKGCLPYVMWAKDWDLLPEAPKPVIHHDNGMEKEARE